ncbi:hypothetical protein B1748_19945 [Paenibacillus sp. MY03]|uniref:hypothetical protein n=1 Tax=Paenibacillus sp. MY03 TaxID=302980 RepID=UPI000B3CA786|nr:hypothetical protein [Paenibacillus sp. MY03]OUS74857.1 hypothetical protein B1748_19945 [Paenibacillus sp. MY03]
MDEFHKKLRDASTAMILLSKEFERLEPNHSDHLIKDYPFSVCLLEVVHAMLEWQETINNQLEVNKRGEKTNS